MSEKLYELDVLEDCEYISGAVNEKEKNLSTVTLRKTFHSPPQIGDRVQTYSIVLRGFDPIYTRYGEIIAVRLIQEEDL